MELKIRIIQHRVCDTREERKCWLESFFFPLITFRVRWKMRRLHVHIFTRTSGLSAGRMLLCSCHLE